MTNPQLTENLLAVIRSLPADDRRWLLRQLEQDSSDLSHGALAEMAMAGAAAGALTGSPIPGASPGQEDLASLLGTLRKPTMTVQPGRGMERGAM